MRRPSPAAAAALAGALAAAALLGVRAWAIDYDYSIDFQAYWLAGARVAHGEAAKLYDAGGGAGHGTPVALDAHEFKNLPVVAWAFVPFAATEYATAKRAMWWTGLAAILASSLLLGLAVLDDLPWSPVARVAGCAALLLAGNPAHVALRHGQTTPWVLLAMCVWLAAARRGDSAVGGAALGAACLIKFPPLALAALDVWKGRFRSTAGLAAILAASIAVSLLAFGPTLHAAYLAGLGQHAGTVMTGHNNQSFAAVASRFAADVPSNDWSPSPLASAPRIAALAASAALIVALLAAFRPGSRGRGDVRLEAGAFLAAGIVTLPVAWDHYFLLLLAGLIALGAALHARGLLARPGYVAALVAAYALIALPTPHRWIEAPPAGWLGAAVLSHACAGALAVAAIAIAARHSGTGSGGQ